VRDDPLLDKLEAMRVALGMNHVRFALDLGVNPATWSLYRRGLLVRAAEFRLRVLRKYPSLAPYVDAQTEKEIAHAGA
jgi:hypothetical protein